MSLLPPSPSDPVSPDKKKTSSVGTNSGSSDASSKWLLEGVKSHGSGVGLAMASYGTLRTITPQPEEEKTPPPPMGASSSSMGSSPFFNSCSRDAGSATTLTCSSSTSSVGTTSTSSSSLAPHSPFPDAMAMSSTTTAANQSDGAVIIDILPRARSRSVETMRTTTTSKATECTSVMSSNIYGFYSATSTSPNVLSPRCLPPSSSSRLPGVPKKIIKSQSVMNLHSILRTPSERFGFQRERLRKSTSVGFALDLAEDPILSPSAPKKDVPRLTDEEKEDLYRSRPDLNISPVPSFVLEHLEMLKKQKQRKIMVSIIAGVLTLLMLMVVYQLVTLDES